MKKGKESLEEKAKRYEGLTSKALKKARITVPKEGSLYIQAEDFMEMAGNYFKDGKHFAKQGDLAQALASFAYAHAWLDAGARLGLFETGKDYKLFTLFK